MANGGGREPPKSSPDGIVQATTHSVSPTGNQVLVKITHSGICGTDEHDRKTDMVLGHEGVGTVQQLGKDVKGFNVGDVVGWGYTHKTCGTCDQCLLGQDQYCQNRELYGYHNFHQGSFGSHAIWDASFLFHIPKGLSPEFAAPLMCGGLAWLALVAWATWQSSFLQRWVRLWLYSRTESKREEALDLGATEFYATKGVEKLDIGKPIDHLLVTANSLPNWNLFLDNLKPTGTIYPFTISQGNFDIPTFPVVIKGLNIQGSAVAARSVHKRMLDFAARHEIHPVIERFSMTKSGVEEGMAKLRDGKMRYRGVLVA
ncbi:chaperonin 10-like protein [Mycena crocata]|nr:chaperonin 10-like protein [Mycena crocata]